MILGRSELLIATLICIRYAAGIVALIRIPARALLYRLRMHTAIIATLITNLGGPMTIKKLCLLVIISTAWGLGIPAIAMAKAACELKQLVTGEEFKTLQKKWGVDPKLPKSQDEYNHKNPVDEITFYDTKKLTFKEDAILRWRKSDGKFTIKNRSGGGDITGAECQIDYVSEATNKQSCQYDTESAGPRPTELRPSQMQKEFLQAKELKWDPSQLIQMGPINSYQTSLDNSTCDKLGDKSEIEFESWIMEKGDRTEMVYEVSVKVKEADKCDTRNQAFRSCLRKAGVDVSKNRGTKTEAVYKFFKPEEYGSH